MANAFNHKYIQNHWYSRTVFILAVILIQNMTTIYELCLSNQICITYPMISSSYNPNSSLYNQFIVEMLSHMLHFCDFLDKQAVQRQMQSFIRLTNHNVLTVASRNDCCFDMPLRGFYTSQFCMRLSIMLVSITS